MKSGSSIRISASRESMDGHPTLMFKPVYKSFRFKTSEPMEGLKVEKHTGLKDNKNVFIANPKTKEPQVVQSPHPDEQWKAAMDYDLPELVAFFPDSGQDEFVKDICIDSGVPSQKICLEENRDLDLINASCMVSSDAESSSDSSAEYEDSSESSNSTVSKHIPEQLWEEEVSKESGLENFTIEDEEQFGEEDDTSSDISTKKTITETLPQIRQVPTKAVWSDSVALSSTDDSRQSKASLETALDYARRGAVFPLSVEFHSRNSSKDGMSGSLTGLSSKSQHQGKNARRRDEFRLLSQSDSSIDDMSDGVIGLCESQQHCSTNARRKEVYPQSDSSEDWMSVSITGCSQSQQHRCENARREVWQFSSVESHPQDSSQDEMSDSVTESSQSQHYRGESCSSVPGPLAIYPSGAIPSFGSISFRSNSSATSSRSFTFPILSSEWIGSPVRMVEADRTKSRRRHRWGMRFLCCSF